MSLLLADIDATCASLGYHDGEKYFIERDTLQGLKVLFSYILVLRLPFTIHKFYFQHIIWILRRDNETHEYRRHIGKSKVLTTDLLPMIINYTEDIDLSDVLLR